MDTLRFVNSSLFCGIFKEKERDMVGKIPTVKRPVVNAAPNEAVSDIESREGDMGEVRAEITLVNLGAHGDKIRNMVK
jgi:hypothetical protein